MFGWYVPDDALKGLQQRVARTVAFEEAMLLCLAESLHAHGDRLSRVERDEIIRLIHSRRISILKQRAVLGSFGISS